MAKISRLVTAGVFVAGSVLAWFVASHHLGVEWRAPACAGVALGLSVFTLRHDPARRLVEAAWVAAVFGFTVLLMIFPSQALPPWWSPALAGGLALAAHALWLRHRPDQVDFNYPRPEIFIWLTAITVVAAIYKMLLTFELETLHQLLAFAAAALGVAALGRQVLPSRPLQVAAALLLPQAVIGQMGLPVGSGALNFLPVAAALGVVALSGLSSPAGILARVIAAISWLLAWHELAPDAWGDLIAASGLLLAVVTTRRGAPFLVESGAFLAIAVGTIVARAAGLPWHQIDPAPFPYGGLAIACCFATLLLLPVAGPREKRLRHGLLFAACALLALWASQLTIWHAGWKPVAILWTFLGFSLVSVGLWRKLAALRHAGFALLTLSLAKLFLVDVWDFGAFTRIAAFLALGVALVVLGFFYNRFAVVLKKILEADGE